VEEGPDGSGGFTGVRFAGGGDDLLDDEEPEGFAAGAPWLCWLSGLGQEVIMS
jgi:hypothetical protein